MREWIRGPGVRAPPRRVGPTPTIPRHQRTDYHRVYAALTYIQSAFTTGETAWWSNKRGPGHARRPATRVRGSISLVSGLRSLVDVTVSPLISPMDSYDLKPVSLRSKNGCICENRDTMLCKRRIENESLQSDKKLPDS